MTCAELRARLVDPASAGRGGHAPVVDHIEVCPDCRAIARAFGAVERLFRPDSKTEPPAGLRDRVFDRIVEETGKGVPQIVADPSRRNLLIAVVAILVLVLAGVFASLSRWGGTGGKTEPITRAPEPATPSQDRPTTAAAPAPGSEAPGSGLTSAPISDEEKALVAPILPQDFLLASDVLASLDPFFPQDIRQGPADGLPTPETMPGEERDLTERVIYWRHLPKPEQQRILALQQAFAGRPEAERRALRQRWLFYRALSPSEQAGLGRVVARLTELDSRKTDRLKSELRTIARFPPERRVSAWRNHAFGKSITGQESSAVERLWSGLP